MGCESCSNGKNGLPRGCKNNGTCSSGGCDKLAVYDWLGNMELPSGQRPYDIIEVRFKNSRKGFYRNLKDIPLNVGDIIVVEGAPGHDVGVVSVEGELARIQVQKKQPNFKPHEARKVYRTATQEDIEKWKEGREREQQTMHKARKIAGNLGLEMKISDVEFQGDLTKATFYYTAEGRVDFRQLIKDLADAFKVRIEMRQIGARQESARLGGIGSCGRELCCSTWLTDFRSVSTASARYQQLSLNPQKLAGQCGKLKCCLNYELDMYLEKLKSFPSTDQKLLTENGSAVHIKTDVFKEIMWYAIESDDPSRGGGLVALSVDRVAEIVDLNKKNKKPHDLKSYEIQIEEEKTDYTNVVGQDDLSRFEHVFKKKKKKRKKRKNNKQNQNNNASPKQKSGPKNVKNSNKGGNKNKNRNKNRRQQKPRNKDNNNS